MKGNPLLEYLPFSLEGHSQFEEKEFVEYEPLPRRGSEVVEGIDVLIVIGKMDIAYRVPDIDKTVPAADLLGDRAGDAMGIFRDDPHHDPPDVLLVQSLRLGINGDDAFEMDQLVIGLIQYLVIRVQHLLPVQKHLHLSREDDLLALLESLGDVREVPLEPLRREEAGAVPYGYFENAPAPVAPDNYVCDRSHHRLAGADGHSGNGLYLSAILVPSRQEIKHVFNVLQPLAAEDRGNLRADPFDILNVEGEFFEARCPVLRFVKGYCRGWRRRGRIGAKVLQFPDINEGRVDPPLTVRDGKRVEALKDLLEFGNRFIRLWK